MLLAMQTEKSDRLASLRRRSFWLAVAFVTLEANTQVEIHYSTLSFSYAFLRSLSAVLTLYVIVYCWIRANANAKKTNGGTERV
jgi:hypothetical protein